MDEKNKINIGDLLNKYPDFKSHKWVKLSDEEKKLVLNWLKKESINKDSTEKIINLTDKKVYKRKRILRYKSTREIGLENKSLKSALKFLGLWTEVKKKTKKKKRKAVQKKKSKKKSSNHYDSTTSSVRTISTPMGNKR